MKFNYELLSLTGQMIKKGKIRTERINMSNLSKGIYIINIYTEGKLVTSNRIIKEQLASSVVLLFPIIFRIRQVKKYSYPLFVLNEVYCK